MEISFLWIFNQSQYSTVHAVVQWCDGKEVDVLSFNVRFYDKDATNNQIFVLVFSQMMRKCFSLMKDKIKMHRKAGMLLCCQKTLKLNRLRPHASIDKLILYQIFPKLKYIIT